jgi:uncharacterized damage-inducible protein DinB
MTLVEILKTFTEYHIAITHRVWESIDQITDEQFLADDSYSRGSIRNLMVHLSSTDRRWLAGLRNQPDVGHLKFEEFPTRASAQEVFEAVANDLMDYVRHLNEEELVQNANNIPGPRWQILLHMINHGTDHRSTVLQKLTEYGAPAFDQDLMFWLWSRK